MRVITTTITITAIVIQLPTPSLSLPTLYIWLQLHFGKESGFWFILCSTTTAWRSVGSRIISYHFFYQLYSLIICSLRKNKGRECSGFTRPICCILRHFLIQAFGFWASYTLRLGMHLPALRSFYLQSSIFLVQYSDLTVYWNRCTFFPSNSCSTGSIFSGSNSPRNFSPGWILWYLLDFLLNRPYRFSDNNKI
jgi:hypothetical protein